jgi:hypothetical protein
MRDIMRAKELGRVCAGGGYRVQRGDGSKQLAAVAMREEALHIYYMGIYDGGSRIAICMRLRVDMIWYDVGILGGGGSRDSEQLSIFAALLYLPLTNSEQFQLRQHSFHFAI